MRSYRTAVSVVLLVIAAVGLVATRALAGTIEGTLVLGNGSGYTHSLDITVHAPATGTAPIEFVELVRLDDVSVTGKLPYTETFEVTLPPVSLITLRAKWYDTDGATAYSESQVLTVIDFGTDFSIQAFEDLDRSDEYMDIEFNSNSDVPIAAVRFSADGTTWGADVIPTGGPYLWQVKYPYLDPVYGGKATLGSRQVWMKIRDAGDGWSPAYKRSFTADVETTILVSPAQPVTGHKVTFTPDYPQKVGFPAGTHCMWEFMWGNPQSLYYGERDETFGFFFTYGAKGGGYCDPRSFTLPWMQYPRMLVHFEAEGPDGETIAEAWIGSSPEDPAVVPVIDSTDRHIRASNIPMVYVLPDDYTLTLGQPTTYRAYSVNGAPITSRDQWSVAYVDHPLQQTGGTSITFTPKETGYITVCWGTDTTRNTRFAACYDPRVRRADRIAPVTSAPRQRVTTTSVDTTVPVTLTWTGSDTGWGIAKYQLERSTDGGAWKRVLGAKVRTVAVRLNPGHRYQFRVRAVDKAGNRGAWKTGAVFRPMLVADSAGAVTYGSGWASVPDANALGGTLHTTDVVATVTYTLTGRDVAWIAARGPDHGLAKVYLDGKLAATVDLASASDIPARVVFRHHWSTRGTHVLKVVAQATASRPVVDIDGFVVLR